MNERHEDNGENLKIIGFGQSTNLRMSFHLDPMAPKRPGVAHFIVAFSLALAIHLAVIFGVGFLDKYSPSPRPPLQAEVIFKERRKDSNHQSDDKIPKPVVRIAQKPSDAPKKANFFAETDQSTKDEQAAAETSLDPPEVSASPEKKGDITPKSFEHGEESTKPKPPAQAKASREEIGHRTPSIDDYLAPAKKSSNNNPLNRVPTLAGNSHRDAMPFADDLPNIKRGEKTELNTWQWLHAPFFNRIKSKVARVWSPQRQMARYDPNGSLIGQKSRVTVIRVLIDRRGILQSTEVISSSGVAYLDEEAERAFRMAAPFPFPPKELFNENGLFAFDFSFHLQIDNGLSFDFDWNPAS